MDRQRLYERIDLRVEQMIHDGLIQEALNVYEYKDLNALNTVGYKETFEYLDGLCTLDNAIFRIKAIHISIAVNSLHGSDVIPIYIGFHPTILKKS